MKNCKSIPHINYDRSLIIKFQVSDSANWLVNIANWYLLKYYKQRNNRKYNDH